MAGGGFSLPENDGEHRRWRRWLNNVELLHYDKHFDLIAEITGQHTSWILPRGPGH